MSFTKQGMTISSPGTVPAQAPQWPSNPVTAVQPVNNNTSLQKYSAPALATIPAYKNSYNVYPAATVAATNSHKERRRTRGNSISNSIGHAVGRRRRGSSITASSPPSNKARASVRFKTSASAMASNALNSIVNTQEHSTNNPATTGTAPVGLPADMGVSGVKYDDIDLEKAEQRKSRQNRIRTPAPNPSSRSAHPTMKAKLARFSTSIPRRLRDRKKARGVVLMVAVMLEGKANSCSGGSDCKGSAEGGALLTKSHPHNCSECNENMSDLEAQTKWAVKKRRFWLMAVPATVTALATIVIAIYNAVDFQLG